MDRRLLGRTGSRSRSGSRVATGELPLPVEAPDADQARVDTRELKASCVLLLHSMLEGQSKGASKGARVQRRILKALEELKKDDIKNEVMKIYKVCSFHPL